MKTATKKLKNKDDLKKEEEKNDLKKLKKIKNTNKKIIN